MGIRIEERPVEAIVEGSKPVPRRRRGWTGIVLAGLLALVLVVGGGIGLFVRTGSGHEATAGAEQPGCGPSRAGSGAGGSQRVSARPQLVACDALEGAHV